MSYLLIDIGNSFVKYATYETNTLSPVKRVANTLFLQDVSLMELNPAEQPQGILLVSVADAEYSEKIISELESHFECSIQRIKTQLANFGVTCGYHQASLLGDDRWLVMLAAFNIIVSGNIIASSTFKHGDKSQCLMIVDCGSVVTVDVVDSSGQHLGGWMMPNSWLMASSLGQKSTAIQYGLECGKNAVVEEKKSQKLAMDFGRSTRDCVELGSQLAVVGFIEQCLAQIKNNTAVPVRPICFLTGGGAEQIIPLLSIGVEYRPNLVFDGLILFIE